MRSNIERTASGARVTSTPREQPTRSGPLLAALRRLEEDGQRLQVLGALAVEARHRAPRIDASRAFQVRDLECDALVLRALVAQVGRAEVVTPDAEVGVAVETADALNFPYPTITDERVKELLDKYLSEETETPSSSSA